MADDYPILIDFEWFATDGVGHIARFTTGGEGPIPSVVLKNMSLVDAACDAAATLPRLGGAKLHVSLPRPDDFEAISAAGIFGYDWYDVHRTKTARVNAYEKLSSPTRALLMRGACSELREAASLVRLDQVRFDEVMHISSEQRDWLLP